MKGAWHRYQSQPKLEKHRRAQRRPVFGGPQERSVLGKGVLMDYLLACPLGPVPLPGLLKESPRGMWLVPVRGVAALVLLIEMIESVH